MIILEVNVSIGVSDFHRDSDGSPANLERETTQSPVKTETPLEYKNNLDFPPQSFVIKCQYLLLPKKII